MTEAADEMEMQQNAMRDAKNMHVELLRNLNAEVVNRPAFAKELTTEEALNYDMAWRAERSSQKQSWKEVVDRFDVPEGQVPIRWKDYWILSGKRIDAASRKAGKELGNGSL